MRRHFDPEAKGQPGRVKRAQDEQEEQVTVTSNLQCPQPCWRYGATESDKKLSQPLGTLRSAMCLPRRPLHSPPHVPGWEVCEQRDFAQACLPPPFLLRAQGEAALVPGQVGGGCPSSLDNADENSEKPFVLSDADTNFKPVTLL